MLTERIIRDAKPGPKPHVIWDRTIAGLGVRVFPSGGKAFVLSYRSGGRKRLATLARCSELSLKAARDRAGAELVRIREGETDPLDRRREAREAPTVADGVERFLGEYASERLRIGRLSPRTVADYRQQTRRYILPVLGKLKVADVNRRHIEVMVKPLRPVQRNRVLAVTSRLFTLYERWEWRPQHSNPVRGIERAREEPRDRVLDPSELGALASALDAEVERSPAAVAAIRVAALTGLRIGEVLAIRWEDVSFETGRLTMPVTKTGRRTHDLPTPAVEVLAALPRINSWCFTTGADSAITYKTTRAVFARVVESAGLDDVRLHDLRRTVMTNAAMAWVGTHVLRDLLGHKTTAMADRYVRAVGNPVRDAREAVAGQMAAMMRGKGGEVVTLRGRDARS